MPETVEIVHGLYRDFFERGLRYFFPKALLRIVGSADMRPELAMTNHTDGCLELVWMGAQYRMAHPDAAFSEDQVRLVASVGAVLAARYQSIFYAESAAATANMFEGLPEDRYVSAFLDHEAYLRNHVPTGRDVVADAIEVMRESSLLTYENRRISTGVILTGSESPVLPRGALPYTGALVGIKTFNRLCDGLHTVFLVDRGGRLTGLADIRAFSGAGGRLPAPSPARYHAHSLATLHGGNICLVLTPNGEIKIFAGGVQVFSFLEGRWRLTDLAEKYHAFHRALGNAALAERLFTAALNLAEHRRGGLFVIADHPEAARELVAPEDLVEDGEPAGEGKAQLHYLLRGRSVLEMELNVLQSIARVDGGIVLDREGRLLAFGAILRHSGAPVSAQEGGRTTAAMHASWYGPVLKISEDGMVSFYRGRKRVWEI